MLSMLNKRGQRVKVPSAGKDEEEEPETFGEAYAQSMRDMQINRLNDVLRYKWKLRKGRKPRPDEIHFVKTPDNPWRDRYMLCQDCERRNDYDYLPPRQNCNNSTLLEVDMTLPWSRDNVMATSCEIVQLIREDTWVMRDASGSTKRVDKSLQTKVPGAFPVQVCAVCRKISLEEGRRFRMCMTCRGVSYCSDECFAKDRLKHRASCTIPILPHREEWGIRRQLRKMRSEIYPLIHKWAIREPVKHRIAWLPPPEHQRKQLEKPEDVRRPQLPGFSLSTPMLPVASSCEPKVDADTGKLSIMVSPRRYLLQQRRNKPSDPDPEQLKLLGLTREEFLQREEKITRAVERQAAVEATIPRLPWEVDAEAEELEQAESRNLVATPASLVATPASLTAEAVKRIEGAAQTPHKKPKLPLQRAPWEELEDEEAKKAGGRRALVEKRMLPPDMPAPEDRKEGVVYRESKVRELAKSKGLRLSEEALRRLEEAAATGGSGMPPKVIDPRYKKNLM